MMTWNYRVFREESGEYVIREVFYAEDGSVVTCSKDPVEPFGETIEELARDLESIQAALTMPILTSGDVPGTHPELERLLHGKGVALDDVMAELDLADILKDRPSSGSQLKAS